MYVTDNCLRGTTNRDLPHGRDSKRYDLTTFLSVSANPVAQAHYPYKKSQRYGEFVFNGFTTLRSSERDKSQRTLPLARLPYSNKAVPPDSMSRKKHYTAVNMNALVTSSNPPPSIPARFLTKNPQKERQWTTSRACTSDNQGCAAACVVCTCIYLS